MKGLILLLTGILLTNPIIAETVYKKVNPDGSIEFTDRESKNSEEVKIRKTQTFPAQKFSVPATKKSRQDDSDLYNVTITSPTVDEAFRFQEGAQLQVKVTISPKLNKSQGHKIKYTLGSKTVTNVSGIASFTYPPRGAHTLSVVVVNSEGKELSAAVTQQVHIKQHSKLFKKPSPRP